MTLNDKISSLLSQIREIEATPHPDRQLPQNSFYLDNGDVVCLPREKGESRHPYDADGLVVWARSTGYIEACESTFSIFKPVHFSEDPSVAFFAGIPMDNGEFFPVSLLGVGRQLFEPLTVNRYVVYSPRCAYYITDTDNVTFAVRLHTDRKKHIRFTLSALNKTDNEVPFYISSYFEAILRFSETEMFWDKMSKFGKRYENGSYLLRSDTHCLVVNSNRIGGIVEKAYHTAGRSDFIGCKGRTITNGQSLRTGIFTKQVHAANTTDIPVAADILHTLLSAGEEMRIDYDLSYYHSIPEAKMHIGDSIDVKAVEDELSQWNLEERSELDNMKITFSDWDGKLRAPVINRFLRSVQKQISFCALGKNYAGPHIGVRDVFQQLEGSLIWQPERSRKQIVAALNFILEDGRPPRQFSFPATPDAIPDMDMRMYIDQGVWVISTIYTYLSYTGDYSILDEKCSYYVASDDGSWVKAKSSICDSVLCHMIKIMEYLASNIDYEYGTECLRVLYGDWNDALDALGKTDDPDRKFGSGVTVMATLQFYQNCNEMKQILKKIGGYDDKIAQYDKYRAGIEKGLMKNAVDVNEKGEKRIIHGWGDKLSYKIGSWHDPDGKARRSGTSNAFWILSGMIDADPALKYTVLETFKALRSKYGLMTFDEAFPQSMKDKAGRICTITPGTYENAAVYVHASMFAIMALFSIGEGRFAWDETETAMVISHDNCTMTTFAMPNSYCYNPDYDIDGESMGDWYTGSGTVLVKGIIKYGFGIMPTLDSLRIQTPAVMPCTEAQIEIRVKGHPITVRYENRGAGSRKFMCKGKELMTEYDSLMKTPVLTLPDSDLYDGMVIEVID